MDSAQLTTVVEGNPQRYVLFTVLYNARAYYPVLAVFFLDLGLSLDQFVMLNLVWAATIFCFEVPSGALADTVGRRSLLIAASVLMVVEMACLLTASWLSGSAVLVLCVINRLLSGVSEACASGADEALAYDSLPIEGRESAWDRVMAQVMRWRAVGFVAAMLLGGVLYDGSVLHQILPQDWQLSTAMSHRLPVFLVLCQGLVCCVLAWRMIEPQREVPAQKGWTAAAGAMRLMGGAARWVIGQPRVLALLIVGVAIDAVVRNMATINSSYYRGIDLPEWSFGLIGAAVGVMGWFVPRLAQQLNQRFSPLACIGWIAAVVACCLWAVSAMWPLWGVLPAVLMMACMGLLGYTLGRALHAETDSAQRATVLSLKGMLFNLGYGAASWIFATLLSQMAKNPMTKLSPQGALSQALLVQAIIFTCGFSLVYWGWARRSWSRGVRVS